MGDLTCLKQGPGGTTQCAPWTERKWRQTSIPPERKGRLPLIGGIDVGLAYWLPGKQAEGPAPHSPFDKLSGGDVLNSRLEQSLAGTEASM